MLKADFSRFLDADPGRLHVAAHSHHPWPDVSFDAHRRAWLDAAELVDGKWDRVFGEVIPEAQRHVVGRLGLPDPSTVTFAPNTHEFVMRLLSCLPPVPRVLTSDAEFHSFSRQMARLEEDGAVDVQRVPAEPVTDFDARFAAAAADGGHDLVFVSHVFFDSGGIVSDLPAVVDAVPDDDTFVVIDGYHAFMALPVDAAAFADRAFYLAGGYKYAMAGEGAVFLHCPPGYGPRPPDTGWFAGFGQLEDPGGTVAYASDGSRFMGATFDPSGLYRFNAVQRWLDAAGVDVATVHAHVRGLQDAFLERLDGAPLSPDRLVPPRPAGDRGNFLTFASDRAAHLEAGLARRGVVCDRRGDRLRLGFGVYHDEGDVDELVARLATVDVGG